MYGGHSGCDGIIVYNTDIKGNNAVYGYYVGKQMRFETGTLAEMKEIKRAREKEQGKKNGITGKLMAKVFLVFLTEAILGFVLLPLRCAFALSLFLVLSWLPVLVISGARTGMYDDPELRDSFRRFHGCEHAVISALTKKQECAAETIYKGRYYDTECGTAYSGYVIAEAAVIALLIAFRPGLLKAAGLLLLSAAIIFVIILVPGINPFTIFQRPVVLPPSDHEVQLGLEIMKRVKEL